MELFIALNSGQILPPVNQPMTPVHMAYRIGPGFQLFGTVPPPKGGLMLLDSTCDGRGDPLPCAGQILQVCRRREHTGIVLDLAAPPWENWEQLLSALDSEDLPLYVPEPAIPFAPSARVLIPSPLISGSLEGLLQSAMERYGRDRTLLVIQWQREDLLLPANGRGRSLTSAALEEQLLRLQPATFFDRGLCAHYYTYMEPGGKAHFVVFDTPQSIRAKIQLARRLDIAGVLLALPEVEEHLSGIFSE